MSKEDVHAASEPTVTYAGEGWFETPLGEFGLHGDYGVVVVPAAVFERLELLDVRKALVAAKAAGDVDALEWLLTNEPNPNDYEDPGARDGWSLGLNYESEQAVVRVPAGQWVEPTDPQRDTVRTVFAPWDERLGTKTVVVDDEHGNMAVEITVPDVSGSRAMRIGDEAVALLGALAGGGITLDVAAGLVRAGMADLLLGQRESAWLDAKRQPYGLSQERHKIELAKDVAAFANGVGGLILIGARTQEIRSGERLSEIKPVPLSLVNLRQIRDVLDSWVYPVVERLDVGVVEDVADNETGIAYIYVPLQAQERRPFLVAGTQIDGNVSSVFVSVPTRRHDHTAYSDVASIHGLLLAGRLSVAGLNRPGDSPRATVRQR